MAPKLARKLKVLGLHGHEQNGELLRGKIGSVRSEVKSMCEFIFMDAPMDAPARELLQIDPPASHSTPKTDSESTTESTASPSSPAPVKMLSWFDFWSQEKAGEPNNLEGRVTPRARTYVGVDKTLAAIAAFCETNGPFDGIFAFSQGCVIASIWLALAKNPAAEAGAPLFQDENPANWRLPESMRSCKFSVFASGLLPTDPVFQDLVLQRAPLGTSSSCPGFHSLHCFGEKDDIIPPEWSLELQGAFRQPEGSTPAEGPVVVETASHDGGHVVASSLRKPLKAFMQAYVPLSGLTV